MLIDISWPLFEGMATYPNNPPFKREIGSTGSSTVSRLELGTHTGTHVDAPAHVLNGTTVDQLPLATFVGPCRVIDATAEVGSIGQDLVESIRPQAGERILFKTTNSALPRDEFVATYVWLSAQAAAALGEAKVALVGVDYLSVKQRGSSDNRPHTELLGRGIPIVEGLDLSAVQPGTYELTVLPLLIKNGDGAPARAILKTNETV